MKQHAHGPASCWLLQRWCPWGLRCEQDGLIIDKHHHVAHRVVSLAPRVRNRESAATGSGLGALRRLDHVDRADEFSAPPLGLMPGKQGLLQLARPAKQIAGAENSE